MVFFFFFFFFSVSTQVAGNFVRSREVIRSDKVNFKATTTTQKKAERGYTPALV